MRSYWSVFIFGVGVLCTILLSSNASAIETNEISWTSNDQPSILLRDSSYYEIYRGDVQECRYQIGHRLYEKNEMLPEVCVHSGLNLNIIALGASDSFVSFGLDEKYYRVYNLVASRSALLPGTDTLTVRNLLNTYASSFSIYHNFSDNLERQQGAFAYIWNNANPDYVLKDENNSLIAVRSVGYSENAEWAAIEAAGNGIILLNLKNFDSKLVSKYWVNGNNVAMNLRVSNDGRHIAIGGHNAHFKMIDVSNDCGVLVTSVNLSSSNLNNACPEKDYTSIMKAKVADYKEVVFPTFDKSGGELSVFVTSYDGLMYRKAKMLAPGYTPKANLDYIALGDSYSSGEGDTEKASNGKKYYRSYTDNNADGSQSKEKCHISTRSYPYILASNMSLGAPLASSITKWNTVACSGSTTWDMKSQGSNEYKGQYDRLKKYDIAAKKVQALNEFIPGRQKQVEFVREYRPQAITLTMGGNDIGFAEKVKQCAIGPWTCDFANSSGQAKLAKQINDQFSNLKSLYEELYQASGEIARIYVVGYPQFINGDQDSTCGSNIGFLDASERKLISKSVTHLNNVIEHAAKAAGVKYVDIEDSLNGHRLCDSGKKYVTGIAFLGSSELQESFHPNAEGHAAMADAILGKVNQQSLLTYSWCVTPAAGSSCPDATSTKNNLPMPEGTTVDENMIRTIYTKFMPDEIAKNQSVNIQLPPYSLRPGSQPSITLRSNGQVLVTPTVNTNGSLNISVLVPGNTPGGGQAVDISGETYSGEPVNHEQVVIVEGPNENDKDDDGILDSQDKCLYVVPANKDEDRDGIDDACDPDIAQIVAPVSPSPSPSPSATPSPTPTPSVSPTPTPPVKPVKTPSLLDALKAVFLFVVKLVVTVVKVVVAVVNKATAQQQAVILYDDGLLLT